jgi:thiamine-phosphate pyrophosphorylase
VTIALSPLYAIVDAEVCAARGWRPHDLARAFLAGGARLLQLRAKTLPGGAFLDLADAVAAEAGRAGATLIVNDRPDIARLVDAAGVHVGQDDLRPSDARRIVGADAIVGLSTHTVDQIDAALAQPITYLAIGPTYSTATKATGYVAVGLSAIADASRRAGATGHPVVAIGGITLETAPAVIAAGAASVAVITDLVSQDPEKRVRQYLAALA